MKRFVSLTAVSTERQAGDDKISLEDQAISIQREVDRWDGNIIEKLVIPGHTRSYTSLQEAEQDIPAYKRLHELIVSRSFDVLIFFNYSRLARDIGVGGNIVSLCQKYKIVLYVSSSPPSDLTFRKDAMQLFMASFGLAGSHNEKDEIMRRHERGMINRTLRGEFAGRIPYGWKAHYDAQGHMIVEVDADAKNTLSIILDLYLAGQSLRQIAAELKRLGKVGPKLGKPWHPATLRNTIIESIWRYAGFVEMNRLSKTGREYVKAACKWPALISTELAEQVEREKKHRHKGGRYVRSTHRFSGLVYCEGCGKRMGAVWIRNERKNGKIYMYESYRCVGCTNGTGKRVAGQSGRIPGWKLDKVFRDTVESPEYRSAVMPDGNNEASETKRKQVIEAIAATDKEISGYGESIARLNDLYVVDRKIGKAEYDRMVAGIQARIDGAQARLIDLQKELAKANREQTRNNRTEQFLEAGIRLLETGDVVKANAQLRDVGFRFWVRNGEVTLVEITD